MMMVGLVSLLERDRERASENRIEMMRQGRLGRPTSPTHWPSPQQPTWCQLEGGSSMSHDHKCPDRGQEVSQCPSKMGKECAWLFSKTQGS